MSEQGMEQDALGPYESDANAETGSILSDLSGGEEAGAEMLANATEKSGPSRQTIITISLLIVSAACIYGMRMYGTGSGMKFETPSIDYTIEEKPIDRLSGVNAVLGQMDMLNATPQIPLEAIDKNPFHFVYKSASSAEPVEKTPTKPKISAEELRKQQIADAYEQLTLHSIIGGSNPVAKINGDLVRMGDTVSEFFVVKQIENRVVVLEADGSQYPLTIGAKFGSAEKP